MDIKQKLDELFPEQAARCRQGRCRFCGSNVDAKDFIEIESKMEFQVSGLCVECQSKVKV